jgi:hypothetical protein
VAGALADIFTAVRLALDGTGFEAQATALATKAGQNAGQQMSQQITSKLKSAAAGAAGAAGGLALASAINGATQLNELAGQYQVQTGANAQQAKAFQGTLNDLFKVSHQGYDEIAATLIGLKTHFDMDGAAAKALAANILDFAEITGGTGADAVERLNSLVKTGVIAQADMAATMDKLTLAHQTWGININETLDALTKFAPAMNAFGMTTDQAIAWMSIFNKAGVDSSRVVMGFNTALQKVKTPAEFNALIAKIAATPDALERAKLAVSLFGARAGGALANMLKPGTQSVADMAALIGTDYVGAVEKAAAVNDNTFGGRALLMLHQFQGTLAEMGTNMGDLLIVFAMLGPGLTKGLLMGLGGIGGLLIKQLVPAILSATLPAAAAGTTVGAAAGTAAGTAVPGAFAAAAALAFPAMVGVFIAAAGIAIAAGIDKMAPGLAKSMHDDFFAGLDLATEKAGEGIQFLLDPLQALNRFMFNETPPAAAAATDAVKGFADAATAGGGALRGLADAAATVTVGGVSELAAANLALARSYVTTSQASKLWSDHFRRDMQATAPALNTAKTDFDSFLDSLGIGPARAKLQGELTGAKLAAGLKTGTKASRAAGAELVQTLTDQLNGLSKPMSVAAQKAELEGELLTLNHARGIAKAANDPTRMALIDTMISGVKTKMSDLTLLAYTYGMSTGSAWSRGIVAAIQIANPQIGGAIKHVQGLFKATSPPGPESPLHEIDKWGARTGQTWVDNLVGSITGGKAGIMGALGGLAMPGVAGGSFTMPYAASRPDFSAQAGQSVSSTASTINRGGPTYNVNVTGLLRAETPDDIGRVLRRTAALGMTS